ncbi:MAG: hypothetical protein M0C28_44735 [Candidatus Moduliflexus flocculans]|nr:hypothetical protein [Candidatus Moduliflexus flocculans]
MGRTILQLYNQTDGSTLFYGRSISEFAPKYVGEVIKNIPDAFPKYLNEKKIMRLPKQQLKKFRIRSKRLLQRKKF